MSICGAADPDAGGNRGGQAHHRFRAKTDIYADEIIFSRETRYQHIVLTRFKDDLRLFLNSHLQFSSRDEYRYHEALVHPGLSAVPVPRHVLDNCGGLATALADAPRSLKYPQIESVTLVDLDPEMTRLFSTNLCCTAINLAFSLPLASKVHMVRRRRAPWIDADPNSFDFIVIDFPDPTNYALKLYAETRIELWRRHLSQQGLIVVQSASPHVRSRFFLVHRDDFLRQAGLKTAPASMCTSRALTVSGVTP